ncbi:polyprenol monophosphomannose synthase [Calycomorphotria hydatis]|uniref:Undecaprenyl-phosphate mannosyltransferase n=1 Tax=Calycomorphotria hydatis TaxID=2528027 RepID=A0A517T9C2_9PLAN|nr:polyprenol monophosphomannose synthase [Calycomorphotria hydatis]QDT64967.1 Undecaprenyl-phosphate mannosyltransferase [Calycomorphotria hydatis]
MAPQPEQRLLITACTYNERENLPVLVEEVHRHAPTAHLVVVDDGSPDGTGELADEFSRNDERIHVLHRTGERGLGVATVDAFKYGLEQGYDLILNLDADLSHHPRYIPDIVSCMDQADVVIGSRYVPGGSVEGWPWTRHVMSTLINSFTRFGLRIPARDCSGSFRCYRREILEQINFSNIIAKGYAFQEEILFHCRRAGARFHETPICFEDRIKGDSKISIYQCTTAVRDLVHLMCLDMTGTFPKTAAADNSDDEQQNGSSKGSHSMITAA